MRAPAQALLHRGPSSTAETVSEVLLGEQVEVLEQQEAWCHIQLALDGYQGWVPWLAATLQPEQFEDTWATVTALRGHIYAGPAVSEPILGRLSLGGQVRLSGETFEDDGRVWERLSWPGGWIQRVVIGTPLPSSPVELGLRFVGTPYHWGGRSAWGIDCSGLVQVLHQVYGLQLPRDSGQQRLAVPEVDRPQAGDLAFFPGHVGLMLDERRMLNATSYHMAVAVDTLGEGDYGKRLQRDLLGFGRPDWSKS